MYSSRRVSVVLASVLVAGAAFGQATSKPSTADQARNIRVGIAVLLNRSHRAVVSTWERDQLVRELQRLRKERKSSIVLEAIPLDATSSDDAGPEAKKKGCQYFVLTTLLDPSHGPAISGGPGGVQRAPVTIGNANTSQTLAVDFTILEVDTARTLAEGTSTTPTEDNNDTRATDQAIWLVAQRIAQELHKDRPPHIDWRGC